MVSCKKKILSSLYPECSTRLIGFWHLHRSRWQACWLFPNCISNFLYDCVPVSPHNAWSTSNRLSKGFKSMSFYTTGRLISPSIYLILNLSPLSVWLPGSWSSFLVWMYFSTSLSNYFSPLLYFLLCLSKLIFHCINMS